MTNLKKQHFGTEVIVEISSDDRDELVQTFWSFWNHGATNGEFCWTNDGFGDKYCGYFWTDTSRLEQSCINREIYRLSNNKDEISPQNEELGQNLGKQVYENIPMESFYIPQQDAQIVIDKPEENG